MLSLREILVTTDLSEESTAAFGLARDLAEAAGAGIALLTVVEDPVPLRFVTAEVPTPLVDPNLDAVVEEARRQAMERLEVMKVRLGSRCGDALAIQGISAAREILRVAEERRSDLIVLATHGRSGLARVALGSTAERIVREAPCPVLTVRTHST